MDDFSKKTLDILIRAISQGKDTGTDEILVTNCIIDGHLVGTEEIQ